MVYQAFAKDSEMAIQTFHSKYFEIIIAVILFFE